MQGEGTQDPHLKRIERKTRKSQPRQGAHSTATNTGQQSRSQEEEVCIHVLFNSRILLLHAIFIIHVRRK